MKPVYSQVMGSYAIGMDLWGWALPAAVDIDYGVVAIRILCFFISYSWM